MTRFFRPTGLALAALVAVALLALPGCPHDEYTIELTPQDDKLHRTLTIAHWPGVSAEGKTPKPSAPQLDEAVLKTINKAYIARPTERDDLPHWEGTFGPDLPDDLGGTSGTYVHYKSSLGTACIYAESFRGNNDAYRQLERRFKGADTVVDLARGFLQQELGEVQDFKTLDAFMDTTLRRDLKTLAVYAWQLSNVHVAPGMAMGKADDVPTSPPTDTQATESLFRDKRDVADAGVSLILARSLSFLIEQDYFDRTTLGMLPRLNDGSVPSLLRHILTTKVKLPADGPLIDELIAMTEAPDTVAAKLQAYIWTTDAWRAAAKALGHDPLTEEPDERAEIERQWARTTGLAAWQATLDGHPSNDRLALTLHATGPVIKEMTNGRIASDERTVSWAGQLHSFAADGEYYSLPLLCHAAWATPNAKAQKQHFGRTLLDGEDLLNYTVWVEALPPAQREQWSAYIATLSPETAMDTLDTFPADPEGTWHAQWREKLRGELSNLMEPEEEE